jgi:hypothetical protein
VPKMRTQLVAARTVAEALADLATVPDSAAPRPTGHPSRRSPAHARKASSSPSDGPGLPGCAAPARARVWLWVRHARRPRRAGGGARCGGANRRAVRGSDDRDGRRLRGPRRGAGKDCRRRGVAKTARIVALALLGAAAAVAAVAGELHTGAVWGSPLSDLVWTLDATMCCSRRSPLWSSPSCWGRRVRDRRMGRHCRPPARRPGLAADLHHRSPPPRRVGGPPPDAIGRRRRRAARTRGTLTRIEQPAKEEPPCLQPPIRRSPTPR